MRAAAVLAVAASAAAVAACGGPAADLFEVIRSGTVRGADITLVPSGDGTVLCNHRSVKLPDKLLLTAENFDFTYHAKRHDAYPSGRNPVYTFVVRSQDGTFSFSDDSPHLGRELRALSAWSYTVAKTVCH
ncbi:MAG TPA: hypothetical protein VIJ83_00515 [Solirubrobacteraceae bacterium]